MQPTDSTNDLDSRIAAAVERAVEGVRDELMTRVEAAEDRIRELSERTAAEPMAAAPTEAPAVAPPSTVGELLQAFVALDRARSQPEVLAALLESAGRFAGRSALFLTRPDEVRGWGSYGFEEIAESLQELSLPYGDEGPWALLAEGRGCVTLDADDCEGVCRSLGAPPAAEGLLLPFVLRDRVAAALYVDRADPDPPLATESLQLLTHVAAHSVEGLAFRQRAETPTLFMAEEAAERPGLAIWGPEPMAAEPAPPAEALPEEAAAPAFVEEEIPEPEAVEAVEEVEEEIPAPEEEAVAVEPAIEEPAVPEEAPPALAPEIEAPVAFDEAAAEPLPPMEMEAIPEEAPPVEPAMDISAAEESLAETVGPPFEPTPALDTMPSAEAAAEEIEAPEPELPPLPEVAPPTPSLEEPIDAQPEVTAEEPTRPLEPLAEPPPAPAAWDEAATAPLEPEPPVEPLVTPPPPPPPSPEPGEVDRGTTEVRPPIDIEGPGWAFTAPRTTAEAGDEAQHEEARRLARLLVTEIKLYNEEQVEEGRRSNDIYARLKEDIDRSRQIFDERVDEGIREETDYFHEEMVRILGGGKPEALGL